MKPYIIGVLIIVVSLSGCTIQSHAPFTSDYRHNTKFSDFTTYSFFTILDEKKPTSLNTALIKKTIAKRMEILGYSHQEENPDLLVAYTVYDDKLKFHGVTQLNNETNQIESVPVIYKLKEGTLLLQIIDSKNYECIWQGYSINNSNHSLLSNDRRLIYAVSQILEQYRIFSMGSMDNMEQLAQAE